MSLFISGLSFREPLLLDHAKLGILTGSTVSGIVGLAVLFYLTRKGKATQSHGEDPAD